MTTSRFRDLVTAKQVAASYLLKPLSRANFLAVGIGRKVLGGMTTEQLCVRVYVQKKFPRHMVPPNEMVPRGFLDVESDVIESGHFGRKQVLIADFEGRNTVGPGSRIRVDTRAPNVNGPAVGTLGAVVKDGVGKRHVLGCNHTLAKNGRIPAGSEVISVPPWGSELVKPIAIFDGHFAPISRDCYNFVDCALACVEDGTDLTPSFPDCIQPYSVDCGAPSLDMRVAKLGGATGLTYGTVVDIHADVSANYSFGTFRFSAQVLIEGLGGGIFATNGDSGAVVVDIATRQAIALVFAEAGRLAVACPLAQVLQSLAPQSISAEGNGRGNQLSSTLTLVLD